MEICGIAWRPAQLHPRAPDNEAVGPVSLYFIAFAGLMTNFDHKNRVVKA